MSAEAVAVAMSGGVDSTTTLLRLQRAGHRVRGYTMRLWHPDMRVPDQMIARARDICAALGVEHRTIDLGRRFESRVVDAFVEAYRCGRTPNPCALCNRDIKLGAFVEAVLDDGCDLLATGHYARLDCSPDNRRIAVQAAVDPTKDQSYFLSLVSRSHLRRLVFPMAEAHKRDIQREAEDAGLTPLIMPSESQEICFVSGDDYRSLLKMRGLQPVPGQIVHRQSGKVLGEHSGLHAYTIGQRRGLGVSWSEPLYVCGLDMQRNLLLVGTVDELVSHRFRVHQINWQFASAQQLPLRNCLVKYRYRTAPVRADIEVGADESLLISTREPARALTPGQVLAAYDDEGRVLLGGIIGADR